jgi:hypothetical protein
MKIDVKLPLIIGMEKHVQVSSLSVIRRFNTAYTRLRVHCKSVRVLGVEGTLLI